MYECQRCKWQDKYNARTTQNKHNPMHSIRTTFTWKLRIIGILAPHAVYILPVEIAEEDTLDFVAFVIRSSSDLYETDPLWKGYLLNVFFR